MLGRALRTAPRPGVRPRRSGMSAGTGAIPTFVDSALTAQKETEGTTGFTAASASSSAGGVTILSWVALRTAIFAGPVTGNNGNTHTEFFSQAYGNGFTNYSLRGYRSYNTGGGSFHLVTGNKSSSSAEEVTIAMVILSRGTIVDSDVTQQVNAGAGHTFTSNAVTFTGPGMMVAVASGDGNVNATAPTQTWPGDWTVRQSVAFSSAVAPNGHVPLYVATKPISAAGDYTVAVQVTIDEGLTLAVYAVQ